MNNKLSKVDSLLQNELADSAYVLLSGISPSNLNEEDKAYYILLKGIEAYYKDSLSVADSLLSNSIAYYEDKPECTRLAMSYIYKGGTLSINKDNRKAILYFKKAEELLDDVKSADVKIRVIAWLAWENLISGNYDLALSYSQRALNEAKKADDKRWIGSCYEYIGTIYYKLGNIDSLDYYQECAIPYIQYQPIRKQIIYIGNQASYYWRKGDLSKAEKLLEKLLKIHPTARTYGQLAEIYTIQGRYADAEKFWENAFKTQDLQFRLLLYTPYADWLKANKREREAVECLKRILPLRDSLALQQQTEAIKEAQAGYDRQITNIKYRNTLRLVLIGTALLACIFIIVWLYYHLKTQKAKNRLAENQIMITDYTARIGELEKDGKAQSKEVRELKRKLDTLRGKQTETLYKGKRKYEDIVSGGTAVTWHKSDYNDVVEYYRSVNMPFVLSLENEYKSLTAGNKFYLLLSEELKFGDNDICRIMGLTDGALRTMKYRIKKGYKEI